MYINACNGVYLQFVFSDVKFSQPQEQILAVANIGQVCSC